MQEKSRPEAAFLRYFFSSSILASRMASFFFAAFFSALAARRALMPPKSFFSSGRNTKNSAARITSVGIDETRKTSRSLKNCPAFFSASVKARQSSSP